MAAQTTVRGALRLRRWALGVLRAGHRPPPECTERSWRLFFAAERCAMPLRRRMRITSRELPQTTAQTMFEAAVSQETQKTLLARAQLREIGDLATHRGWKVVVLKGGLAALAEETAVDLVDLDLLAPPGDEHALAAALDAAGYERRAGGSTIHLDPRARPAALPIEIHLATDVTTESPDAALWQRVRPVATVPGVWRLAPPDHLWHLLMHLAVQHPYRHGSIRDLFVVRSAVGECLPEEIEGVVRQAHAHEHARSMRQILAAAESLCEDGAEDVFRREAALLYLLNIYLGPLPLPWVVKQDVANDVFALTRGQPERRWHLRVVLQRGRDPSFVSPIAWLERHTPPVGRVTRLAARLIRVGVSALFAVPLWWAARRTVRSLVADQ